jgi:hypothetical protein
MAIKEQRYNPMASLMSMLVLAQQTDIRRRMQKRKETNITGGLANRQVTLGQARLWGI